MYFVSNVLIVALGFLYPAYKCYKAIKSNNNEQLNHWTLYWVVMATFYSVSKITDIFISWLPLYYEAKVLFTIYIMVPQTKGAAYLYVSFLQPFLDAHETEIDLRLNDFKSFIRGTILNWAKLIMDSFKGNIFDLIIKAQAYVFNNEKKSLPKVEQKIYPDTSSTIVVVPKKEGTTPVPPTITISDSVGKSEINDTVDTPVENIGAVKVVHSDSKTSTPPLTPNTPANIEEVVDKIPEKEKKVILASTPVKTSTTASKAIRNASTGSRTSSPSPTPTPTSTRSERASSTGAADKTTAEKRPTITKKTTTSTTTE